MNWGSRIRRADDVGITGLLDSLSPEPLLHLDTTSNVVTAIVILADVTGIVVAKQIASSATCVSR